MIQSVFFRYNLVQKHVNTACRNVAVTICTKHCFEAAEVVDVSCFYFESPPKHQTW